MNLFWLIVGCQESTKNIDSSVDISTDDTSTEVIEDTALPEAYCGDGIVNSDTEQCDDGADNSNAADACREDCVLPYCGDGILDSIEDCDDGNSQNLDGCDISCAVESGTFENEPNQNVEQAQVLETVGTITASLWEADMDCFTLPMEEGDYFTWTIFPDVDSTMECPATMTLYLYEDAELVDTIFPLDDSCLSIDAQEDTFARFAQEDVQYTICMEGFLGSAVNEYVFSWEIFSNSCTLTDLELTDEEDPDQDALANFCDSDDDNDGLLDTEDNCPIDANNGQIIYHPSSDGYIRDWIMLGAINTTGLSTTSCLPIQGLLSTEERLLSPTIGGYQEDLNEDDYTWTLYRSSTNRVGFLDYTGFSSKSAPREIFTSAWVYSDSTQNVTAAFGPDDGGRVWINGTMVGETSVCQGTSVDKYNYAATLNAGWNLILLHVRDNGGDSGLYFRFKDSSGNVLTDYDISVANNGYLIDNQIDTDGDGIGDQCEWRY